VSVRLLQEAISLRCLEFLREVHLLLPGKWSTGALRSAQEMHMGGLLQSAAAGLDAIRTSAFGPCMAETQASKTPGWFL